MLKTKLLMDDEEEEVVDELVSSYGLLNFRQLAGDFRVCNWRSVKQR